MRNPTSASALQPLSVATRHTEWSKRHSRIAVGAMMSILLVGTNNTFAQSAADASANAPTFRIVKSRILVRANAGLDETSLDEILRAHGGRRLRTLKGINVHVVEIPSSANEMAVTRALRANPNIKFAEPDVLLDPTITVNDPEFPKQWHLPKIAAPFAWDGSLGAGVTIAILDSGVDSTHPDITAQIVPGWNTFENNSNSADVTGHGTIVASVAAGAGNNGIGVASVAYGSKIMPIRVTDAAGTAYTSTIASGLTWAADHGARISNISFQGASASATVLSAAQYMRSKGGVVIGSSGNSGALEAYPATDYMTVVGATDSLDAVASFSSYGAFVDVAAPGVSIYSAARGGMYINSSGTSVSSPIVAGIYGLVIAAKPTLAPTQFDSALFSTAQDLGTAGKDDKAGWGRVNAEAAVAKAKQMSAADTFAPEVFISSPGASSKLSGTIAVAVAATDDTAVVRTDLYVNNQLFASETLAPYSFALDTTKFADGATTLQAKAADGAGNVGASTAITVNIANDTVAPVATIQSPIDGSKVGGTVSVSASATDDKLVKQVSLVIDGREVAIAYGSSTSASVSYSWPTGSTTTTTRGKAKPTTSTTTAHTVAVTATDGAGNSATKSVTVYTQ